MPDGVWLVELVQARAELNRAQRGAERLGLSRPDKPPRSR